MSPARERPATRASPPPSKSGGLKLRRAEGAAPRRRTGTRRAPRCLSDRPPPLPSSKRKRKPRSKPWTNRPRGERSRARAVRLRDLAGDGLLDGGGARRGLRALEHDEEHVLAAHV